VRRLLVVSLVAVVAFLSVTGCKPTAKKTADESQKVGASRASEPATFAVQWRFETDYDAGHSSSAIGDDGTLYYGGGRAIYRAKDPKKVPGGMFFAVNPDGSKKWEFALDDVVFSSPALAEDGTVYFGSEDHRLYALGPKGKKKWTFTTGGRVTSSPAIGRDGTVYVGSGDKKLYAVSADGKKEWAFKTGDRIISSPAIASDGTIYIGSDDHKLYAIDPDGTRRWAFTTEGPVFRAPTIGSDGTIYVGSNEGPGYLYAINPDGTEKWRFKSDGPVGYSPVVGSDGTIYAGGGQELYAVHPDGTKKWVFETPAGIDSSAAIGKNGTIYVGSHETVPRGSHTVPPLTSNLYAINPDGTQRWKSMDLDSGLSSPIIGADGTVYVGAGRILYALAP